MPRAFSGPGSAASAALVATILAAVCLVTASCGGPAATPGCKSDHECNAQQVCAAGRCVECITDAQCGAGQRCVANACTAAPECMNDTQCPSGKVCQAGTCRACAADRECGPGGVCEAGACKQAKACGKDDQCADDEDCVNGFCRKAGGGSPGNAACTMATVYFAFDDSTVRPSERDRLAGNVACLEKTKGKTIYLIGHTDGSGTEEYNIALSERRAQTVADYMSRLGADPARMQVIPKGETEPTGLGEDKDRRVEFQWH